MRRGRATTSTTQDSRFLHNVAHAVFPTSFLDDVVDWIAENLEPSNVFTEEQLAEWAKDNGYEEVTK